jgi:hypothetical protein
MVEDATAARAEKAKIILLPLSHASDLSDRTTKTWNNKV